MHFFVAAVASLAAHRANMRAVHTETNAIRRPSMNAITRTLAALFAATMLLAGNEAAAQPWPAKPIKWVVPFAPGGTTDILARTVGDKLSQALGQPVIIENKPGAGGGVGAEFVAKSAPDGYTIMGGTISTHAINASLYKNLPYDPVRDFVPIVLLARVPNMLVVNIDVPAKSVPELVALLKANPGKYTFASSGNGTSQHLSGELFKSMSGTDMQHIPYKGSPPALQDVMGGQVTMTFDNITTAWTLAKAGKLRALAVTTASRSAVAPDVPTLAESGLPGFEVGSWQGVFAPAGTPPEIVKRLNAEIVKILNLPDVREKLAGLGAELVGNTPEEFAVMVKAEVVKWADVVKKSGAKVD
jgi:tripartite-type tricarboxylate transporter receptor subunit TctC